MAEHLKHLLAALEVMVEMMATKPGNLNFNAIQCTLLGAKIVGMREHLRLQNDFSSNTMDHCGLYFEKLCSVVTRANKYVQQFCEEKWVEKAIYLGQTSTWLSDILFDLDWWCEVVRCALLEGKGDSILDFQVSRYEGFIDLLGYVDQAAQSDLNDLVLKLKGLGNIEEEDGQLPAFLLHKILKVAENDGDAAVLNFLRSSEVLSNLFKVSDRPIYKGQMVHVYRSEWFGLPCAKKVMDGSHKQEASFLTSLSHPNVHQLFYYGEKPDQSSSCLVTESMDKDLSAFLEDLIKEQAPLTIKGMVDIAHQVAKGMRYLHDMGVAHRDLKSANVLVSLSDSGDIQVKITDFGNSKGDVNTSTYGAQTTNVGTKYFQAPEVYKIDGQVVVKIGSKRFPYKADIYSFAMICVELLTGLPLYRTWAVDMRSVVFQKLRPPLPDNCPQFLQNLIAACWDDEPKKRPTFIEICEALQSFQVYLCTPVSKPNRWSFYDIHQLVDSYKKVEQVVIKWLFPKKIPGASKTKTGDDIGISEDIGSPKPIDKSPWEIYFEDWKQSIQFMQSRNFEAFLHIHLGIRCGYLGYNTGLQVKHFNVAMKIEPDNFYAARGRGQAELQRDLQKIRPNFAMAMQDLQKANNAKPRDVRTLVLLGRAKRMMKDFAGALKYLDEAYKVDSKYGDLFWERGSVKKELERLRGSVKKDYQDVLNDYNKAVEFNPCKVEWIRSRGVLLGEMGCYEDALKDRDRVLHLTQESSLSRKKELI